MRDMYRGAEAWLTGRFRSSPGVYLSVGAGRAKEVSPRLVLLLLPPGLHRDVRELPVQEGRLLPREAVKPALGGIGPGGIREGLIGADAIATTAEDGKREQHTAESESHNEFRGCRGEVPPGRETAGAGW